MSVSFNFPPIHRDFQVYQRVILEAATTRQAAADFSLSQTRIRQIVQRVSQWLAETLPQTTETDDAAYLRLAHHVAADRLQYIYCQAMHGWRATNESKYAGVVLRVIAATSKLPVISGTLEALAADATEGPLPRRVGVSPAPDLPLPLEKPVESATNATAQQSRVGPASKASAGPPADSPSHSTFSHPSPPLRDCSTSAPNTPAAATPPATQRSATPAPAKPSDNPKPAASTARRAFFAPAQSSLPTGDPSLAELQITPQQLGLSVKKAHSRRERRKRRRAVQPR